MPMIQFDTTLFEVGTWTILKLPDEASAKLPSRGQVMVKGTINGIALQTPLEPDGRGSHWFKVDKRLQQSIGAGVGDSVTLEIEATKVWPDPDVPSDLQAALDNDATVKDVWLDITPMARWEWLRWINSTNKAETRQRRIEVSCSKMLAGNRRPCCFNRNMCCVPDVSKNGVLLEPATATS